VSKRQYSPQSRSAAAARPSTRASTIRTVALLVVLIAAGTWAYAPSFSGVFLFDDGDAIVDNANLRHLWPLTRAVTAPPDTALAGRPVPTLTFALNYALTPAASRDHNTFGYHAANLAIHLGVALLLFGVVRRTLLSDPLRERWGEVSAWLAWIVALIWVVHPLTTSAVTYIVQRAESLMGLFLLTTLYCAIRAVGVTSRRRWWIAASIAVCALGMASKETMVVTPLLVALWIWLFAPKTTARPRALYAGLAATWLVLPIVAFSARRASVGFGLGWTWWSYLLTQAGVIVRYLSLAIVPSSLVFDYGWPKAVTLAAIFPPVAIVVALFALTVFAVLRRWPLGFAGAWFFLILAPSSSILPIATEVAAEHRMYLPLAAVIVVVIVGIFALVRRALVKIPLGQLALGASAVAVIIAVIFAGMTRSRNVVYQSAEQLWKDTIEKRPLNVRARITYAILLMSSQRYAEAATQLRAAVRLDDASASAHLNLGTALVAQGRLDDGIVQLQRALMLDARETSALGVLGEAYLAKRDPVAAMTWFDRAIAEMPDSRAFRFLLNRVAWLYATLPEDGVRNAQKAVALAQRAVQLSESSDPTVLATLGAAYAEAGRFDEAQAVARDCVTLARAQGKEAVAQAAERQLALYSQHRPLREGG